MIRRTLLSFIILLTLLVQPFSPIIFAGNIAPFEERKALSSSPFEHHPSEDREDTIAKLSMNASRFSQPNPKEDGQIQPGVLQSRISQKFIDFEKLSQEVYDVTPDQAKLKIMQFAEKHKVDIDAPPTGRIESGNAFSLKRKTVNPSPGIDDKLSKRSGAADAPDNFVTVLQFGTAPTLRQVMDILDLNVRPFFWVNQKTLVAQVDKKQIPGIAALNFVRWIGEYEAIYKYTNDDAARAQSMGNQDIKVLIFSLNRNLANAADLEKLGAKILSYNIKTGIFGLQMPASIFLDVANLSWVKQLEIAKKVILESHQGGLGFEPDDSREIINAPDASTRLILFKPFSEILFS